MSLDILTESTNDNSTQRDHKHKLVPSWLFPLGLFIGFLLILMALFGKRFLPAVEVETSRVITVRAGEGSPIPQKDEKSGGESKIVDPSRKGRLLFQASGWVEPDPYVIYVPTLIDGVVKNLHVLEGEEVEKGQLLAELVDDDARLALQSAELKISSMQKQIIAHCKEAPIVNVAIESARHKVESYHARLEEARDEVSRLASLSKGVVSAQKGVQAELKVKNRLAELEEVRAAVPRLEARLGQIQAEREAMEATLRELETERDIAKLALERTKITAPINGIVLHLHAAPGKKRMLGMDDPKSAVIVELYEPKKLQARIDVPLNEAASLLVGQWVELASDLLVDTVFRGRVTRITGQADMQRNTLQAKVSIENPDSRLRPDMLVRAKFFGRDSKDLTGKSASKSSSPQRLELYIPQEALVEERFAWVVSTSNTAELRSLTLGDKVKENYRLVLKGVYSGEQVILSPNGKLKEGTRVHIFSQN